MYKKNTKKRLILLKSELGIPVTITTAANTMPR